MLNTVKFGKFPYDKNYQVKIAAGRQQGKSFRAGMEFSNKIWKDKIKAKIEELIKEGNYRTADNPNGRVHFQKEITDYQIEVLQSLLEKE